MSFALAAVPSLLEFLNAREVAIIVYTQQIVDRNSCADIWFWLNSRIRSLLPAVEPSRQLQWLQTDALHIVPVLRLLRQLHAVATYTFDLHFDVARHGRDVYLAEHGDYYVLHSGPNGGSIFGDRICIPDAVSYCECVGFEEGCYIGVTEVATQEQSGYHCNGIDAQHLKWTLSLSTPACDHMPAVMYCESGFITTGSFRGPKLQLPANVNFLDADPFKEEDHIGVLVDLLAGFSFLYATGSLRGCEFPLIARKNTCQFLVQTRATICNLFVTYVRHGIRCTVSTEVLIIKTNTPTSNDVVRYFFVAESKEWNLARC